MSAHPLIPPLRPPQQPAAFADAEVRGKMRQWKQRLARQYHAFDRASDDALLLPIIQDMIKRSSDKGRRRAFAKLAYALGPGVTLEGLRLDGKFPLAVWSILKPRVAVTVNAAPESGRAQNCVTVNYVLAAAMAAREAVLDRLAWQITELHASLERCAVAHAAMLAE